MNGENILIIGKNKSLLAKLGEMLNSAGYQTCSYDVTQAMAPETAAARYDLVVFEPGIKPVVKQCLEDVLKEKNERLVVVTGLYRSAPLIAEQVKLALYRSRKTEKPFSYIDYDINEGRLSVTLCAKETCSTEISLYHINLLSATSEQLLFTEGQLSGKREVEFNEKALSGFGAKFIVIRANKRTCFMQRL